MGWSIQYNPEEKTAEVFGVPYEIGLQNIPDEDDGWNGFREMANKARVSLWAREKIGSAARPIDKVIWHP